MSLVDCTNEEIALSLHEPLQGENYVGAYFHEPALYVDGDSDSSFTPSSWVGIHWADDEHDSDRIKLTYEEAGLLHDRLGLILGRTKAAPIVEFAENVLRVEFTEWQRDLIARFDSRIRSEWPGTTIPHRMARIPNTIHPNGATDTLIKLANRIIQEEVDK